MQSCLLRMKFCKTITFERNNHVKIYKQEMEDTSKIKDKLHYVSHLIPLQAHRILEYMQIIQEITVIMLIVVNARK